MMSCVSITLWCTRQKCAPRAVARASRGALTPEMCRGDPARAPWWGVCAPKIPRIGVAASMHAHVRLLARPCRLGHQYVSSCIYNGGTHHELTMFRSYQALEPCMPSCVTSACDLHRDHTYSVYCSMWLGYDSLECDGLARKEVPGIAVA